MSYSENHFQGKFGRTVFSLTVADGVASKLEDIQLLLKSAEQCCIHDYFRVVVRDNNDQPIRGRAGRRCANIILSYILRGGKLPITYLGGWSSGGDSWGPLYESLDEDPFGVSLERWENK